MGGGGGGLPCSFLKIEKSALNLEKKALIVSIFGLSHPFKKFSLLVLVCVFEEKFIEVP